jgi:hypothetical protein
MGVCVGIVYAKHQKKSRRQEYLAKRRNKIQHRKKKSRLQTNVHGVLFAPSPPVADHSLDVVDDEQTRNVLMTPRDGQDLQKDLDQAKEYVGSAAQVGAANEGVVALAPPPTTRRDRMRHHALIELTALSRDDPQPQLAPIPATGKRPSDISLAEINVRKLRLQVAPLLGIIASTFCVAKIPFHLLTMKRSFTISTIQWWIL